MGDGNPILVYKSLLTHAVLGYERSFPHLSSLSIRSRPGGVSTVVLTIYPDDPTQNRNDNTREDRRPSLV